MPEPEASKHQKEEVPTKRIHLTQARIKLDSHGVANIDPRNINRVSSSRSAKLILVILANVETGQPSRSAGPDRLRVSHRRSISRTGFHGVHRPGK